LKCAARKYPAPKLERGNRISITIISKSRVVDALRRSALTGFAAGAVAANIAYAAPPTSASIVNVMALPSAPLSTIGVLPHNFDTAVREYHFSVYEEQSFSQTIPVRFRQVGSIGTWTSVDVGVSSTSGSGLISALAAPASFDFTDRDCETVLKNVATGPLALPTPGNPVTRVKLIRLAQVGQTPAATTVEVLEERSLRGLQTEDDPCADQRQSGYGVSVLPAERFLGKFPRGYRRRAS
jgi:hypothetical protein